MTDSDKQNRPLAYASTRTESRRASLILFIFVPALVFGFLWLPGRDTPEATVASQPWANHPLENESGLVDTAEGVVDDAPPADTTSKSPKTSLADAGGRSVTFDSTAGGNNSSTSAELYVMDEAAEPEEDAVQAAAEQREPIRGAMQPEPELTQTQPTGAPLVPPRSTARGIRGMVDLSSRDSSRFGTERAGGLRTEDPQGPFTRFFGLTAQNTHTVAYVIDCSGSMGKPPLKLRMAKEELIRSIEELDPAQSFFVIFFSHESFPMPGANALPASEKNKERVCSWIDNATPRGGTNPLPALTHALQLKPQTIYVLSDGLFKGDYARAVRTRNRGPDRSSIYTINFGDHSGERQLLRLARENNGQYRYFTPNAD